MYLKRSDYAAHYHSPRRADDPPQVPTDVVWLAVGLIALEVGAFAAAIALAMWIGGAL